MSQMLRFRRILRIYYSKTKWIVITLQLMRRSDMNLSPSPIKVASQAMQKRLRYGQDCKQLRGGALARRALWRILALRACRAVIAKLCAIMTWNLERRRGRPDLESRHAIVRLWHVDAYQSVSRIHGPPWQLRDGVALHANDPVLEMHIAADMLIALLSNGTPWRVVIEEEFRSLGPVLQARPEVALVGDTILRTQVLEFGASVRDAPPGPHRLMDTFYRRLILLVFHRGGVSRAMQDHERVVEVAISRVDFCRRYGGCPRLRDTPMAGTSGASTSHVDYQKERISRRAG
jgi:hypothetical protein